MVIPGGTGHGRGGIAGWLARYHEPPSARVFCRRREAASHRLHPVLPPRKFRNFISTGEFMPEFSQLPFFIGASLALLLVPGPAVLYITARSANQGRIAGLVSVLAIETANFLQAVAAALGVSAILLSSALAFDVVKYLGAAYLIYLGIRKLLTPDKETE